MKFKPFSKFLTNFKITSWPALLKESRVLKEFQQWIKQGIEQGEIGMRPEISNKLCSTEQKQQKQKSEVFGGKQAPKLDTKIRIPKLKELNE